MAKAASTYICQQCGYSSPQFLGKCPNCGEWNSLVEQVNQGAGNRGQGAGVKKVFNTNQIVNLKDVNKTHYERLTTSFDEVNRVLGGGIVLGSVVLISGDPGVGKSTLLTQVALDVNQGAESRVQGTGKNKDNPIPYALNPTPSVLYVAGEESAQQIKIRADRISKTANLAVLNETDVDVIVGVIDQLKPTLVIIDSIQTMQTSDLESVAGSVGQVRESAHRLQNIAKSTHTPIFLVGHVTKEGTVAGPRTLEHLVDVVLSLEGESSSNFRVLRASKNRFGPTDEVGIFEMEESGVVEVKNPSKMFLEQKVDAPGSAVVAVLNGFRPLLVEVQALVTKTYLPIPRRQGSGVDNNRLQLLVATLTKRLNLPLGDKDIFVNVTGGLKVTEPAADLGICLAIISSLQDKNIPKNALFIGEVGLLGEVRNVRSLDKRAAEAKKLGFTKIISPENTRSLSEAVKLSIV